MEVINVIMAPKAVHTIATMDWMDCRFAISIPMADMAVPIVPPINEVLLTSIIEPFFVFLQPNGIDILILSSNFFQPA